ncbi:winged helix-turn-helix domain-containing protein [Kluyvera genomosp. 2]|uniref:winged helix-turn-helix domain-containing protein n=1 Tax=Kluyvera genomosp. 2 TaxID=2774054 RepID=UPI002FD7B9E9
MKYLLADAIVYDNEDGSLTLHSEGSESQTLTCTAQTILNLLIAHHGMVVEREVFLQQVWDDRGLRGSSNSLNQYISILRKLLAGLVPERLFIVTVPKVGFMLSADIAIVPLGEPEPAPVAVPAPAQAPIVVKSAGRQKRNWIDGVLTAAVLVFCTAALIWNAQRQQFTPHLLTHIGSCPVYTLTPLSDVFTERAKRLVMQIKEAGTFTCLPSAIFYFHPQDPVFYGDKGRLVLSQCSQFRGKASSCQTLFFYEW